jgi:AraC-like DNA-binding protein
MSLYVSLMNCFLALVMMIYNWRVNRNTIFLSLLIFFLSSYAITAYFLVEAQDRFWIAIFYAHPAGLWFLPGPLLYFYTRGTLEDKVTLRKSDVWHLVPSLVAVIGVLPYSFESFEHKLRAADQIIQDFQAPKYIRADWLIPFEINNLIRPSVMIGYTLVCIGMVLTAQKRFSLSTAIPYNQWKFSRNWLLILSSILLLASIHSLIISIHYYHNHSSSRVQFSGAIYTQLVGFTLTLLSIMLILFPRVLYGIPRSRENELLTTVTDQSAQSKSVPGKIPLQNLSSDKEENTQPETDPFSGLGERVLQLMNEKKPYLKFDFSLNDMAYLLDVPKHHLYYCFQNVLHTKFTRLRTTYRIEHAKKLLTESDLRKITLDSIGQDSGFASKSGFYNTFKAEVGCSPGEFAQAQNRQNASDA